MNGLQFLALCIASATLYWYATHDVRKTMTDHGFISLGKYSSARDSILHYLCTSGWGNDSFGDVEAPTGYVWRISNDKNEVHNFSFDDVLGEWFTDNPEVTDSPELREELVGHFLITENNQGFISVAEFPSENMLLSVFNRIQEDFNAWDSQDEEDN